MNHSINIDPDLNYCSTSEDCNYSDFNSVKALFNNSPIYLFCMQHFLSKLNYPDKNHHVVKGPDPLLVGHASSVIEEDNHILGKSLHPDTKK